MDMSKQTSGAYFDNPLSRVRRQTIIIHNLEQHLELWIGELDQAKDERAVLNIRQSMQTALENLRCRDTANDSLTDSSKDVSSEE
jgi:hypothetical protein